MVLNGLKNCRLTFLIPHWNLRLSPFWGRVALLLAGLGGRLCEFMGDRSGRASERGRGRISREHRRKREGEGEGEKKSPRAVRVYAPEGSYFLGWVKETLYLKKILFNCINNRLKCLRLVECKVSQNLTVEGDTLNIHLTNKL